MNILVVISILTLCVMIFVSFFIKHQKGKVIPPLSENLAYKAKKVMTPTELDLFLTLNGRLNNGLLLLAQVRLADFIDIDTSTIKYKSSNWYSAFNKITAKSCDLVVINQLTGEVMACIEINDFTHSNRNRINRDLFFSHVLKKINIPLFFIDKSNYTSKLPKELFTL